MLRPRDYATGERNSVIGLCNKKSVFTRDRQSTTAALALGRRWRRDR